MSQQNELDIDRPLPVGLAEFNEFANRIITLGGSYADEDSMRFALASMVMHADGNKGSYSDRYFIERLRKVAANQVAAQVLQDIKVKQQEAAAAREAQTKVEATTPESVVSDGEKV